MPFMQGLPMLNAVLVPNGVDDAAVRKALLERFGIEIGGGLGPGMPAPIGVRLARPDRLFHLLTAQGGLSQPVECRSDQRREISAAERLAFTCPG